MSFDLIYIDPPYNLEDSYIAAVLRDIVVGGILDKHGYVFLENASVEPILVEGLTLKRSRKLGGTYLSEYFLEDSSN
ncbi:putative 95 family protein [Chlamydia psittaci 84-8471/1]|nr:putative 95 family protein [Chlamydia psittaci 84-8471/1]